MSDGLEYLAFYFGQDFDLDYPDPAAALVKFRATESAATVDGVVQDIESWLMSDRSDEEMARVWIGEYHAYFEPSQYGMTYREWLTRSLKILREGVPKSETESSRNRSREGQVFGTSEGRGNDA